MEDENGSLNIYGRSGDYVQMALYTLMNSVCNYLECKVTDDATVATPLDIDDVLQYKLEQAANLIKNHLLNSVREEMRMMQGKLSDLEIKIYRLEMENMLLLREFVPAEILAQQRIVRDQQINQAFDTESSPGLPACTDSIDQRQSICSSECEKNPGNFLKSMISSSDQG